jgi:hypothetical protein
MAIFGYSYEDLLRAQRDVLRTLEEALTGTQVQPEVRRLLQETLYRVPVTSTPAARAEVLASALLNTITQLHGQAEAGKAQRKEDERVKREHHTLQQIVATYQQHPLQEEVLKLTQEIRQRDAQAQRAAESHQRLEAALTRERQAHHETMVHYQEEIAELRRLLVAQQEQLNAYTQ